MTQFFLKLKYSTFYTVIIGCMIFTFQSNSLHADTTYYIQSPKAKLLTNPKMDAPGSSIEIGTSVRSIGEQGLFVQVRHLEKTGWISKLFLSTFPPGKQMKLGVSNVQNENLQARQRASDFTKTAAARGLSETEKLRVRGSSQDFDFDGLKWLEKTGNLDSTESVDSNLESANSTEKKSFFSNPFNDSLPPTTKLEVKMGRSLAAKMIHKYGIIRDIESTKYLNRVGQDLSNASSRTDLSFRFGLLDTDEINAFACPGGFIFVTRGAVKAMESESELATVLAHEISHIVLNHHGKFEDNNIFLEVISSVLGPTGGEVVTTATSDVITRFENEFFEQGRDQETEWEADESAIYLVSQLGYQSRSYPDYLKRISEKNQATVLSKTHPSYFQRSKKLEKAYISLLGFNVSKTENSNFLKLKESL